MAANAYEWEPVSRRLFCLTCPEGSRLLGIVNTQAVDDVVDSHYAAQHGQAPTVSAAAPAATAPEEADPWDWMSG